MTIRAYNKIDKEKLLEIFQRNTPKYFDKGEMEDFKKYLEQNGETYFTIEQDDKIVGGIGYDINKTDRSGSITWIFFDPSYSGKGLGRKTVAHCLKLLSNDQHVERFAVRTSQFAYGFFERFGFRIIKMEKDYWGKGFDLYEMEMPNK